MLWLLSWLGATLLLYGSLFGWQTLAWPMLSIQLHNLYIDLPPGHALVLLGVLLGPLAGSILALLRPQARPLMHWLAGLGAIFLIYVVGGAVEALAHLQPVGLMRIYQPDTTYQVPADSPLLRLLPILRAFQVLLGGIILLAGYRLGRRQLSTKTPGSQD